jgi:hypothetical protein
MKGALGLNGQAPLCAIVICQKNIEQITRQNECDEITPFSRLTSIGQSESAN